ncbi:MAG: sigma-70 family RNA polymerase sigma factor [Candidatus Eisenbacteria bacterium]|nr:sigma-70 family RNA polymerase sigma factor [Candidatus Eisenbacteria bacterium]
MRVMSRADRTTDGAAAISSPSSLALVRRIQDGDADAWDSLYLRYRDRLLLSIRCRLGPHLRSRLESEDILHSVFKDVLNDLDRFEPRGPSSLNHYLHTCVLNKIRTKADYYTAQKRAGEVPLSDSLCARIPNPSAVSPRYSDASRFERLEWALNRLPESMREVVILRRVEELSNQETAQLLGKTPEATSKMYNRTLAKLGILLRTARGRAARGSC